ncbi:MAG: LytR/AlgR family response regulator transcription factor [Huintestinicola sp.]
MKNMMNIAVCDNDEIFLRNVIAETLAEAVNAENANAVIHKYTDGSKLLSDARMHKTFDIVVLDIDMPGLNGKQLAEKLRAISSAFFLVFVTSFKEEVYNTIPYRINAFISKDSDEKVFVSEFRRVIREYAVLKPNYVVFEIYARDGLKTLYKLPRNDIFYICCKNKSVYLHTDSEEILLAEKKFEDVVKKLDSSMFLEISRGYVVNIFRIKRANAIDIVLDNDVRLAVSRRKHKAVLDAISKYISNQVSGGSDLAEQES